MASLKNRILYYLESSFGLIFQQVVDAELLGRPYRVLKGTLRSKPDQDDAWLLALAGEARLVFDIGSNIGQAALLLLHPERVEQIVLVDPNPLALSQAAQNLIMNGRAHRARLICAFASDQVGENVDFYTVGTGAAGSMYAGHARTASSLHAKRSVPTTTVDSLVRSLSIAPDLVKIDVEGAERLVLHGAVELARRHIADFFVEVHSGPDLPMGENVQSILDWCQRVGYEAWYLKDKTRLTSPELIAGRGRCHLLLLPSEADFPPALLHLEQGASLDQVLFS